MEPIQFDELVEETCDSYQNLAQQKSIRLDFKLASICILGNPTLLSEAIGNLIGNAIKYTPSEGQVIIQLVREADLAVLTVSDNVTGISNENQPLVFDRFFRVDKVRTSDIQGGIGLGLAITKSIIETHAGQVGLTSDPGIGTTFKLTLEVFEERLHH